MFWQTIGRIKGQRWGWTGKVRIEILNLDGSVKETIELENEIKNLALNAARDRLKGSGTNLQILYMAWGSSNTANAKTQTQLVGEFGRKQITSQSDGATGIENTTTYIAPFEGNTPKIEELGWFAGTATGTANSGLLVARVLYSHQKTNLESINVVRSDTFA